MLVERATRTHAGVLVTTTFEVVSREGVAMAKERILGLLLIGLGAVLLVTFTTEIGGEIVVGATGLGFLLAYVGTRSYGFLVPGGILSGLGTGLIVAEAGGPDEAVVLGLGIGFLAIAVVDRLVGPARGGWWWPFIPGGILSVVGASAIAGEAGGGRYVLPGILILLGVVLLMRPEVSAKGAASRGERDQATSA